MQEKWAYFMPELVVRPQKIKVFGRPGGYSMKLKRRMIIELTDSNTGAVETVTEKNMIMEAVNDLFAFNPFGGHYTTGDTINEVEWYKTMLPICPKLIGGILLFSKPLTEDVVNI